MQYAPEPVDDMNGPRRMGPRIKRRMLDEMGGDPSVDVGLKAPVIGPEGPLNGNTGIGGGNRPAIDPVGPPPPMARPIAQVSGGARTSPPPAGFDAQKWSSGHLSPKYAYGQVASQNDMKSDAGRQQAMAQLKQQFPQWFGNARLEKDKLFIDGPLHGDFNGINSFDVLTDEENTAGVAWQPFGAAYDAQNPASAQGGGGLPQRGMDPMQGAQRGMDSTQTSIIDQIRASILELMGQGQA